MFHTRSIALTIGVCTFAGGAARSAAAACIPAPSGLVAWWHGDGNFKDIVGGNDAIPQGGAKFSTGKVCTAFLFDGSNDWLDVGNPSELVLTGDLSIVAWVQWTGGAGPNGKHIVSRRSQGCGQTPYQLNISEDGRLEATVYGAAPVTSNLSVPADTMVFVAIAYHSGASPTIDFYVNNSPQLGAVSGVPAGTTTSPRVSIAHAQGCLSNTRWRGMIDEIQIYDRALSSAEVNAIYSAGQDGVCVSGQEHVCVPAVSTWGLAIMGLLVLTAGTVAILRRKARGPQTV